MTLYWHSSWETLLATPLSDDVLLTVADCGLHCERVRAASRSRGPPYRMGERPAYTDLSARQAFGTATGGSSRCGDSGTDRQWSCGPGARFERANCQGRKYSEKCVDEMFLFAPSS